MKIRIEGDPQRVHNFLRITGHPHVDVWTPETLGEYCIMVRVEDDDKTAGFLWGHWRIDDPAMLEFHACVAPSYRNRWMRLRVINDLFKLAEFLGAERLHTKTEIDERRNEVARKMFVRWFGFTEQEDGSVIKEIQSNGTFQPTESS